MSVCDNIFYAIFIIFPDRRSENFQLLQRNPTNKKRFRLASDIFHWKGDKKGCALYLFFVWGKFFFICGITFYFKEF